MASAYPAIFFPPPSITNHLLWLYRISPDDTPAIQRINLEVAVVTGHYLSQKSS
jgi:hypothetical protein